MRIAFLTSTPLNVDRGSGTYVGISTLARELRNQGHAVEIFAPALPAPVYTLQRVWYNEWLRWRNLRGFDLVVGFDMDGYCVDVPHVAAIKGVIADEAAFERGVTRRLMLLQAHYERLNVRRARAIIATSRHSADRIAELYAPPRAPRVVPELIDLRAWRELFNTAPEWPASENRFTVLAVARLYRRKRIDVLLRAAAALAREAPGLEVRIVGDGPEAARLRAMSPPAVVWLGTLPQQQLAEEYRNCDVFCLPSVQEGFGIVLLEAMAAGKPIVAARAAAAPEVAPHGVLVEPDDADALAEGIHRICTQPVLAAEIAHKGKDLVLQYDAPRVARQFLAAATQLESPHEPPRPPASAGSR
ncbi:MAG TPA: glycosyltransferase family 4 protein [Bryobacteraceae bacterium]|nr:glycosyltransferase family 4 protein [Bryobacteraceae bacterium]